MFIPTFSEAKTNARWDIHGLFAVWL